MSKTVDRVLVEWAQDLLGRHPEIELAICRAKVDLWNGPLMDGELGYSSLVDKIRAWTDRNVPGTLWIDPNAEEWLEDEPDWSATEDCPEDYVQAGHSLLMRVLLGDLARYI